jgi:hypothetical protein
MKARVWMIFLMGWGLLSAGCGYRLQGATAPSEATVEVPIFENRTVETGIETLITEQLLSELRRTPGWRIVPPGEGRYALRGTVLKFISEPHFVSSRRLAVEHRASLVMEVRLLDRSTNQEIWREHGLRTFTDYTVGPDVLGNERQKQEAIARIAEILASRIRVHIQDTW